ncbi:MAG: hypothetical protein KF703_03090 [Actinobacteria bacterium]|nr:hypothetical protein [Actinomycetota bacterium]
MEDEGGAAVGVHLGGLDGTMERSVGAFLEARHASRFAVTDQGAADIVLVDLDQPHAAAVLDAAGPAQVVVGIGFDAEPRREGCRRYVQKPLSGGVLVNALADAVSLVGTRPAVLRPVRVERPSHARDLFTKAAWPRPAPPAAAAALPPPHRPPPGRPRPPPASIAPCTTDRCAWWR